MALETKRTESARMAGHVSHDAQGRVDERVKEILARREAAVRKRGTQPSAFKAGDLTTWLLTPCAPRAAQELTRLQRDG
jgi:hypothetical protein